MIKSIGLFLLIFAYVTAWAITNSGYDVSRMADIEKSKVNYNGQKVGIDVPAGATSDLNLTLTDDHCLTGASVILSGNCIDDELTFQVVHPVAGVINTYIQWYATNMDRELLYPAKVPAGLILRAKYKNTCASGTVKVRVNYSLHKILI